MVEMVNIVQWTVQKAACVAFGITAPVSILIMESQKLVHEKVGKLAFQGICGFFIVMGFRVEHESPPGHRWVHLSSV